MDEKETDVDCGGSCGLCDLGKKCSINIDCKTNFCYNGTCSSPKCDDNLKNSDESDVDCGGFCKKCQNDKVCSTNNDCESNYCSFGNCKPEESCADGKLTPGESDIDCGGYCPTKCSEDNSCTTNDDCNENLQCISTQCKKAELGKQACNADGIPDSDCDSIPDDWEIKEGLNPNDANDANLDYDEDGLINVQEYKYHTNPNNPDTDQDEFTDKQELDAGTNPLDSKDFPKSKIKNIIFFIVGVLILVSGIGFLAYRAITKRKSEKFEASHLREISRLPSQPAKQIPVSPQKRMEESKIREALKQKEQQKLAERKKLFEAFGSNASERRIRSQLTEKEKPEEEFKEAKAEKPELKETEKKPRRKKAKRASKAISKKSKEDVFKKLKEIAKESKKKKIRR